MNCICYRKDYKYQLHDDYTVSTPVKPEQDIHTRFIELSTDGILIIKSGYAWDGPSGPTIDSRNFRRGSLVHDAFYQLMRHKQLPQHIKNDSDRLLQAMCREDGMSRIRSWLVYQGVKYFGHPSTDPANKKTDLAAPQGCTCRHK